MQRWHWLCGKWSKYSFILLHFHNSKNMQSLQNDVILRSKLTNQGYICKYLKFGFISLLKIFFIFCISSTFTWYKNYSNLEVYALVSVVSTCYCLLLCHISFLWIIPVFILLQTCCYNANAYYLHVSWTPKVMYNKHYSELCFSLISYSS